MNIPFSVIPTLSALTPQDREALQPLCRIADFDRGEVIFREGDPAELIWFVVDGKVKIVKAAGDRDIIIEILGRGEPVGTVAVYENRPFPATAVAIEPSKLLGLPEREFFQILASRPELTRRLLAGLTLRLMAVNRRIAQMTGTVESRTSRLFLTLADRLGQPAGRGVKIPLVLSRQEIADLVGTTLETAIRLMSRWQKEGIVLTQPDGFEIPDRAALGEPD